MVHTWGIPEQRLSYTLDSYRTRLSVRVSRGTRPSASTVAVRMAPPTSTVSVLVASATGLGEPEVAEVVVPQDAEALSHGPEPIPDGAPGTLTRPS